MARFRQHWIALALAGLLTMPAAAQTAWPQGVTRLIVPFAPGSTPDGLGRLLADRLQARFGTPFIVENKAGASGNTGTDAIAKAEPDGTTLGLSIVGPLALNTLLFKALPYDPQRDLTPIMIVAEQPSLLVVSNGSGIASFAELLERLKQNGTAMNYGSIGYGSLSQLAMIAVTAKAGARPQHVAYTGSPAVVTALARNDIQMAVLPAGSVVEQGRGGLLKMIAATGTRRSALIPDVPTLRESGIEGVEANAWVGLVAPAGLPAPVQSAIREAVLDSLAQPSTREKLTALFLEPVGSSAADLQRVMAEEIARWKPVIEANGLKID